MREWACTRAVNELCEVFTDMEEAPTMYKLFVSYIEVCLAAWSLDHFEATTVFDIY